MRLVVTSGDVSDVDGFYALAAYAQSGSDVAFVMNYPAYLDVPDGTPQTCALEGLGFIYSADQVTELNGKSFSNNDAAKRDLTNVALSLCAYTWFEQQPTGRLFFVVGGVNKVNPFAAVNVGLGSVKNEPGVYARLFSTNRPLLQTTDPVVEGDVFLVQGHGTCGQIQRADIAWAVYDDIYLDFNGSMAFFNDIWDTRLQSCHERGKIRGAFVMGGVLADGRATLTLPSIPGLLNRFSCCTMNQVYAPLGSSKFFGFCARNNLPCYVITNSVVCDLKDSVDEGGALTLMRSFLCNNGLVFDSGEPSFLWEAAQCYYNNGVYDAPRKPFDFYTAHALCKAISDGPDGLPEKGCNCLLFYDDVYGIALVAGEGVSPTTALQLHIQGLSQREADTRMQAETLATREGTGAGAEVGAGTEVGASILRAALSEFVKERAFFETFDAGKLGVIGVRSLAFESTGSGGQLSVLR